MPALTEAATKKVGPLPAWGWGAIAVGGFIAWKMFRPSGNGTTQAGVGSVGGVTDSAGGGSGGGGGGALDTSGIQAAIDNLTTKIGNITIPGTGGTGGGGGGGGGSGSEVPTIPGTDIVIPQAVVAIPQQLAAALPQQNSGVAVTNTPGVWGAPIGLGGPSQDTYVLAQQYYYAIVHPGIAGASRSTLFTRPDSQMRDQLRQLLMVVETSIATDAYPTFDAGANYAGVGYPAVPTSVFEWAGLSREQVSPTSFLGAQYVQQGYQLNIDPNMPGADQSPSVVIAKLQAYIANLSAVPASKRTAAQSSELAMYRAKLANYQAVSKAINQGQAFNVADALASGAPPTISSAPTQTAGIPAPSTTATPVDYSKAINTVQGYIANLQADKTRTSAQNAELAMYKARLADYSSR